MPVIDIASKYSFKTFWQQNKIKGPILLKGMPPLLMNPQKKHSIIKLSEYCLKTDSRITPNNDEIKGFKINFQNDHFINVSLRKAIYILFNDNNNKKNIQNHKFQDLA